MTTWIRDPDDNTDYELDWNPRLAEGEAINTVTVTAPAGLTVDRVTHAAGRVTAWITGGTDGVTYPVTFRVTTNQGRVSDHTARVIVRSL